MAVTRSLDRCVLRQDLTEEEQQERVVDQGPVPGIGNGMVVLGLWNGP